MNNEEKILAILETMQGDITSMKEDITSMKKDIAEIKETLDEHGEALDALIEWTDNVQEVVRVPFAKPKAVR